MDMRSLRPATEFAQQYGVKAVVYGGPGSGKTPVTVRTSPYPVLLASEPGMLTLKGSLCPTFTAFSAPRIDEFFEWFVGSVESKNFHTLIWDSASQGMEIYVTHELDKGNKSGGDAHGKKAYGDAAKKMMKHLTNLYFMAEKHIILVAKLNRSEINGGVYNRPYFPGRELNIRVPHLFDLVTCLGDWTIPNVLPSPTKAFRTKETFDYMGRDRSGKLHEYEPPDFSHIIKKAMS